MVIAFQDNSPVTAIPNLFIDEYMGAANGEYVKVYIYLLRLAGSSREAAGISLLADRLELTEKDVLRALRYWEKQKLLRLDLADGQVNGLTMLTPGHAEAPARETVPAPAEIPQKNRQEAPRARLTEAPAALSEEDMKRLAESETFKRVLYVAEQYLGRTLSQRDVELFAFLMECLGFSEELLEYLPEYCAEKGKTAYNYLESTALGWHQEGKRDVQQIREEKKEYTRENREIMKAFGISGRVLTAGERAFLERWRREYGLPLSVIVEACGVTMRSIHTPSFEYTDSILNDWREAGIKTPEEAKAHLEKRRIRRKTQSAGEKKEPARRSRFVNYDQRETDYDALLANSDWR